MIPFPFNENRFSFFVADHLLVGQLCTNPKSDRSLLSCLKVTQCSTSEIGVASLYKSCLSTDPTYDNRTIASTQAWLQKEGYDFVPFSHWPPPPPTWTRWTTSFGYTSRTSPTWPPTTPKPAWSPPSAEYSPNSCRRLWKRHAPTSGSVLRWWLRLKATTLNKCQLYYIIKLPELIFSIKVLK